MPNINIYELDHTALPAGAYENFSVAVPLFVTPAASESESKLNPENCFDTNGVWTCSDVTKFREFIKDATGEVEDCSVIEKLLKIGYTVLIVKVSTVGKNGATVKDNLESALKTLSDRSLYDFRYITAGLIDDDPALTLKDANNAVEAVATNRKDCTALLEIPKSEYQTKSMSEAISAIQEFVELSPEDETAFTVPGTAEIDEEDYKSIEKPTYKYRAFFAPTVTYVGDSVEYPACLHYLNCAQYARKRKFEEWFAVAGSQRGCCQDFIGKVGYNFGEVAVNTLAPRPDSVTTTETETTGTGTATGSAGTTTNTATTTSAQTAVAVNLIAHFRDGYYLWGNRTGYPVIQNTDSKKEVDLEASHFLNIRQLCTTLKKELYVACRKFSFDPNSTTLWVNFCNTITPLLERMKNNDGIGDYKIIKLENKKKAELRAKIRIVPIEAVEDFVIPVSLENSLDGTVKINLD